MDLLATVRKEGSRGGRSEFQWSDVQNSSHREHYLGHSLMAPVGRWAKGRDLNWYAKGDGATSNDEDPAAKAARERKEEIMRVKQAEEDALARALGLPVAPRSDANAEPVSNKREVDRVLQESAETDETATSGRGIGYGRNAAPADGVLEEKIEGNAEGQDKELSYALKEYRRRHRDHDSKHASRESDRRPRRTRDEHRHRRHRSRSRDRRRSRERRRSRSPEHRHRRPLRSRSPPRRRDNQRR